MRFNEAMQQPAKPEKKKEKPRELPKAGSYGKSDLTAQGVKKGVWEK